MKFFYGSENYLIEQKINQIIKKNNCDLIFYNHDESIDKMILDLTTNSFWNKNKLFLIKNHLIFEDKKIANKLIAIWDNIYFDIIFVLEKDKILLKNSFVKFLFQTLKKTNITKMMPLKKNQISKFVIDYIKQNKGHIDNKLLVKLLNKLPNNLRLIINEIDKLLLYSKKINDNMIDNLVSDYRMNNYFDFISLCSQNNVNNIIQTHNMKKNIGENPFVIILKIISALSLAIVIHSYQKQQYDYKKISQILKIKIFQVIKILQFINKLSFKKIIKHIFILENLEKKIKINHIDASLALDIFLLSLIK